MKPQCDDKNIISLDTVIHSMNVGPVDLRLSLDAIHLWLWLQLWGAFILLPMPERYCSFLAVAFSITGVCQFRCYRLLNCVEQSYLPRYKSLFSIINENTPFGSIMGGFWHSRLSYRTDKYYVDQTRTQTWVLTCVVCFIWSTFHNLLLTRDMA